ncbi:hypothetical protein RLOatenuis_1520 [Rickettsiales bacterium]|nr:hypothetical protein RLOatenuis_1520 [Rickettsiales bacterium]
MTSDKHGITTLKKRADFLSIRRHGRAYISTSLILGTLDVQKRLDKSDHRLHIGYTATKKIGKAVVRNRAKRRLRALARCMLVQHALHHRYYVLIAKKNIIKAQFSELEKELERCMHALNVYKRHI